MQYSEIAEFLKPHTETEASLLVNAKATIYTLLTKVYIPKAPYSKLRDGYTVTKKKLKAPRKQKISDEDLERSIRRTRSKIRDICMVNSFELFVTFTFKAEKKSDAQRIQVLKDWIKNQKKRVGKFEYLVIAERHKSGALHFHGFFRGYEGELVPAEHKGRKIIKKGRQLYNFKNYKSGFSTVIKIDKGAQSQATLSNYVAKYITKDTPNINGRHRYWASQSINRPETEENPEWYTKLEPVYETTNDYGRFMFFPTEKVMQVRS